MTKIVIFTSNALRHKFVANMLSDYVDDALIISECKQSDISIQNETSLIQEHFALRYQVERQFFSGHELFTGKIFPIMYKEANLSSTFEIVKKFQPDLMFVFGSSIIKEPLLSLLEPGHFINLHLGLSPYYRGSGTNFWPFVNNELEFVGSTILHLDAGIDTGDIIAHVRPKIVLDDNVHTVGCKVIQESVSTLIKIIDLYNSGSQINRIPQWKINDEKYYRSRDFTENTLLKYFDNLKNNLVKQYIDKSKKEIKLVKL